MLMCTVTCSRFCEKLIFFHRMIQQESWSGREFFHLWCCFKSEKYFFSLKLLILLDFEILFLPAAVCSIGGWCSNQTNQNLYVCPGDCLSKEMKIQF